MQSVHDLADVSLSQRSAYWQDAICQSFMNVTCRPISSAPACGRLSLACADEVRVARLTCSPHEYRRTREQLDRQAGDHLLLDIQSEGVNRLRQGDRALAIGRDQGHLYSSWEPFDNEIGGDGEVADLHILMVPADGVLQHMPRRAALRAAPLSFATPLGIALRQFVERAVGCAGKAEAMATPGQLYIDALVWFLSSAADASFAPSRPTIRRLVLVWMEQNVAAPLTPAVVARQFGLSTRTLHRCFEDVDASFEQTLMTLRVHRLRYLLTTAPASCSITSLAHEAGFFDAAHATRTFKARFEILPSAFREGHRMQRALFSPDVAVTPRRPGRGCIAG